MRSIKIRQVYLIAFITCLLTANSNSTPLGDATENLAPGEWVVFKSPGYGPELLDACDGIHSILEWSNKASWDPVTREIHFVGQGHDGCAKHISYRESTNSWQEIASPQQFIRVGHGYEHSTLDPDSATLFVRLYNADTFYKYDISRNSWSQIASIGESLQVANAIQYFPEAGGMLYVDGDFGIYFYTRDSNRWELIANTALTINAGKPSYKMGPYHNFASYNSTQKVIYFGGGGGTTEFYKFEPNLRITRMKDSPVSIGEGRALTLADPASGAQLIFADDGRMYEYDSALDVWSDAGTHPVMDYATDWRVGVPLTNHGVILFFTWDFSKSTVLLYRHAPGMGSPIESPLAPDAIQDLKAN